MFKAGRREFNSCQVKSVSSGHKGQHYAELICPRTEAAGKGLRVETEFGSSRASRKLADMAMRTLCPGCPYSGMSPSEVIDSQAAVARAEANLFEAQKLRLTALQELNEFTQSLETPVEFPSPPDADPTEA